MNYKHIELALYIKTIFAIQTKNNYPTEIVYFIIGILRKMKSIQISAGGQHTIINISNSEKTYVFGNNQFGQFGLGDRVNVSDPTQLIF